MRILRRYAAGPLLVPVPVLAVLLAVVLAGCTASESPDTSPTSTPVAEPTPLAAYDTSEIAVARGPFCDLVSPTGIEAALGGVAQRHDTWANGEAPPGGDVGSEYGCEWSRQGVSARAWVFAPPITVARARRLAAGEAEPECRPLQGEPEFGTPSAATTCGLDGGQRLIRFAGLFGDAWLTCELESDQPEDAAARSAEQWCAQVLEAARA